MVSIVRLIVFVAFLALSIGTAVFAGVRYHGVAPKYISILKYDKNVLIDWYSGSFPTVIQTQLSIGGVLTSPTIEQFSITGEDFLVYPTVATGLVFNATLPVPNTGTITIKNPNGDEYEYVTVSFEPTVQDSYVELYCTCPDSNPSCTCTAQDCPAGYTNKFIPTSVPCYQGSDCGSCIHLSYVSELDVGMDIVNFGLSTVSPLYTDTLHDTIPVLVRDVHDPFYSFDAQTDSTGTFGDHENELWNVLGASGVAVTAALCAILSLCCCNKRSQNNNSLQQQQHSMNTNYGATTPMPITFMMPSPMGQPLLDASDQMNSVQEATVVEKTV